jgi:hypothetical protein
VLCFSAKRLCAIATLAATALSTTAGAQTSVGRASSTIARAHATGARMVRAGRVSAAIAIDGRLDDAPWRSAEIATEFVQQRPTPGAAASQRTEARVVFDATALYVSMRMFDSHPDSLRAPLGRRDSEGYGDWAHVIIDSYHDRRTGFQFSVNPAGTRRDVLIPNDAEWQADASWDAVWDVATSRDSLGWTAEFRIPLTQLRFEACGAASVKATTRGLSVDAGAPDDVSACAWGIQFMRDIARQNERSSWAPIAPDAGGYVSRFGTLAGVDGMRSPRRLEIMPYSLAKMTRAPVDAANPFYKRTAMSGTLGADLGIGITSRLTLTATINPDFGQVEADPSEVNLSGFETFLRERRPFFVEGGDIFQYRLGGGLLGEDQLFYSRRIGRAPQMSDPDGLAFVNRPAATTILGAAKLSGKVGSWTVGALDAVTGAERAPYLAASGARGSFVAEPTTNYALLRVSRDAADGRHSIGAVATAVHRDLDATTATQLRSSAFTAGLDARARSTDSHYTFGAYVVGSVVRGSPEAIAETQQSSVHLLQRPDRGGGVFDTTKTSLSGVSAEVRASKQGGGHWRWGANARVVTSGFEANDLGFQLRSDDVSATGWVGYAHFEPGRHFRRWELWSNYWTQRAFGGERERMASNLFADADLQNNWSLNADIRREFSALSTTLLRGGPATFVPPNVTWWARVVSDRQRVVSGELATRGYIDDVGGGRQWMLFPSLYVRPSSRAQRSLQPRVTRMRNPAQYVETSSVGADTSYVTGALSQTTTSLTARLDVTFTPALSLQLYAQPFISAGDYRTLGEVRAARARSLRERISPFAPAEISRGANGELRIDRGAGRLPITLDDPDFTVRALASNAVLRWEYRPGSALFLVWAHARNSDVNSPDFSVTRQARDLWRTKGTNVLLVKMSYWITP